MIRIVRSAIVACLALVAGNALAAALSLRAQQPQPSQQKPLPEGYIRPAPVTATGLAPKMKGEELPAAASKTYRITFGAGDELLSGLTEFAEQHHIASAQITGIGGLSTATLGWGDPSVGAMKKIPVDRKCELVSLLGNISSRNGRPYVHLHVVVSFSDGGTQGGHLIGAHVDPLAEIFVVETEPAPPPKAAK
jgi:predicted DNA-binding protein with PD1-like motif